MPTRCSSSYRVTDPDSAYFGIQVSCIPNPACIPSGRGVCFPAACRTAAPDAPPRQNGLTVTTKTHSLALDDLVASFYTLSGAPNGKPARHSFDERVRGAAAAGYAGIGLTVFDIEVSTADGPSAEDLALVASDHGIRIAEVETLRFSPELSVEECAEAGKTFELGERLGARHVNVVIGLPPRHAGRRGRRGRELRRVVPAGGRARPAGRLRVHALHGRLHSRHRVGHRRARGSGQRRTRRGLLFTSSAAGPDWRISPGSRETGSSPCSSPTCPPWLLRLPASSSPRPGRPACSPARASCRWKLPAHRRPGRRRRDDRGGNPLRCAAALGSGKDRRTDRGCDPRGAGPRPVPLRNGVRRR